MALERLEALRLAVSRADTPAKRVDASVSYCIALAEQGKTQECKLFVQKIREDFGETISPQSAIRLILVTGICLYYETRTIDSFDRVRRAYLLSVATNEKKLLSECAVWLMHLAFNFDDLSSLQQGAEDCVDCLSLLSSHDLARASLIVADASQLVGWIEISERMYSLARFLARAEVDRALIASIEYNRMALGLSRVRIDHVLQRNSAIAAGRDLLAELRSVDILHSGLSSSALVEVIVFCEATLHLMNQQYSRALSQLEEIKGAAVWGKCGVTEQLLDLQIEWCRFKALGVVSTKAQQIIDIQRLSELSDDERLLALHCLRDEETSRVFAVNRNEVEQMYLEASMKCGKSLDALGSAIRPLISPLQDIFRERLDRP